MEKERIIISLLDPRVKEILASLQNMNLIEIHDDISDENKEAQKAKLAGLNLKNVDPDIISKLLE